MMEETGKGIERPRVKKEEEEAKQAQTAEVPSQLFTSSQEAAARARQTVDSESLQSESKM